tara:strand:- start:344 stop:523 length:180 start_codon:yes stop_codon:yes gene_type:complete
MQIINKTTGRDVTREFNGLAKGLITNEEFEVITMTPSKDEEIQVPCSADLDWQMYYESI